MKTTISSKTGCAVLFLLAALAGFADARLTSPGGNLDFAVSTDGDLSYSLSGSGKTLIEKSALGFEFVGEDPMRGGFEVLGEPTVEKGLVEAWKPVVRNRHADVRLEYNRMVLRLREKAGARRRLDLTVNAYDDGVAFRYTLYGNAVPGERRIHEELTEYRVPAGSFAWVGANQNNTLLGPQESVFRKTPVAEIPSDGWCLTPLVVEIDRSHYLALASAALDDYPGYLVAGRDGAIVTRLVPTLAEAGPGGTRARFCGRFDTAWRVILVADTPGRFIESEIIRAVNPPCAIADTSWIRPGISAWDHWWSGDVKMEMPVIKEYIDFAAAQGWPYMLVDWQWYGPFNTSEADITKTAPQIDMPALVAYAKERNVRLILWLYSADVTRNDAYVEAFRTYAKWGIAGVKIDFMDRYDREIVNWYRAITKAAADNRLLVDFHGAFAPDGMDRTYPNQVTREGVLGEEFSKFGRDVTPGHNVNLAFTRLIAGAMDYTPGGFLNVSKADFKCQSPTLVMNTRAAELAKFVIYESPLTVCCEHPTNVIGKAGADFLRIVPTEWDDTRFVGGYPGEWIGVARRSGSDWYVGVMAGDEARTVDLDLSFAKGASAFETWSDGQTPQDAPHAVGAFPADGRVRLDLAGGGGFVAVCRGCEGPAVGIAPARRAEAAKQADGLIAQMKPIERLCELMMDAPGVERLGIRPYHWWNEVLHGVARVGQATIFPQSMAAAASFDPELQERIGEAVSTEARAKYNLAQAKKDYRIYRGLTVWSPNVNMFRDPRWGRGQETYGEDPYLAGVMGGAYVRGLQGNDPRYLKTAACAKHFAVHSGPESLRHGFSADIPARDIAEYYLPAFKALVTEAKVESVMGAYSAINGTPCCANKWLLTDLLRGEWGFAGHVVSDVGAVADIFSGHKKVADKAAASKAALAAGLDLCSEDTYYALKDEVAAGTVTPEEMAVPLRRLYTTRALLGQFDPAGSTPWDGLGAESVGTDAHRRMALQMAEESLVLVHNNGALPLDRAKVGGIGVGGLRAQDQVALRGNYSGYTGDPSTVLSGLVKVAGPGIKVTTEELAETDTLVIALGITAEDEGEEGCSVNNAGGDRAQYGLPEAQLKALKGYRDYYKTQKIITVVFGCSPFDLAPVAALSDAVIVAWYPGERGGEAIARTIFGLNNPSGRLPITYPKSYDDLPDFKDYRLEGRTYRYATKTPLYPFGYGLSYTTFAYANAKVKSEGEGERWSVSVSVDVTNTGDRDGAEVVQLYVKSPAGSGDRRLHHLEGFRRVPLKAGERKTVTFTLKSEQFAQYGADGKTSVAPGDYTIFVGGGQPGHAETVSASFSH